MGVIDTLKDFAGDVADDSKEAFDELLDRDPWDRDPWDRDRWDRDRWDRDPWDRRGRNRNRWSREHRQGYRDGDYYYYCECYCHYHGDPHSDRRGTHRGAPGRVPREVAASRTGGNALPEGAAPSREQAEGAGPAGEPADTAGLSAQINDLTETVNALRRSLEQLPRATANQNGAGT